jgi:hypothetical protein
MPASTDTKAPPGRGLTVGIVTTIVVLQTLVAVTTIARGTHSDIIKRREVIARSVDDWRALWRAHSSQPPPSVDFSRSIAVGVFLGARRRMPSWRRS